MDNKFPTPDSLLCLNSIFHSHDDYNPFEALYAGFDEDFNLIVLCDHTDYDDSDSNCATWAIVDKAETYLLAKKYGVALKELPSVIGIDVEWFDLPCPTPGDVRDCFMEVTDDLIAAGCHLRIKRKPAANGFITI